MRRISTACVIFNPEGRILLGRKLKFMLYEFPGGKLDEGESLIQGAARELHEEAGIICGDLEYIGYFDGHPDWLCHGFAGITNQQPKQMEPDKHDNWDFYDLNKLPDRTLVCLGAWGWVPQIVESYFETKIALIPAW